MIPLESFITILSQNSDEFKDLEKALKLLELLDDQNKSIKNNINVLSDYIDLIESLILLSKSKILEKKKKHLQIELEIIKNYKESRDLEAISNLLKKLNKSIEENKKRAKYLEEDYYQYKNRITQIKKAIENYDLEIEKFNTQKKICFTQINRITRQAEELSSMNKNEDLKKLGININIPNSEKIRILQLKAKDLSFNIKQIKSQRQDSKLKLEEINPKYEVYKNDYEKLLNIIQKDQEKAKELQVELKNKIERKKENFMQKKYVADLTTLRSISQIEEDIRKVDGELAEIANLEKITNLKKKQDFSSIREKLDTFSNVITHNVNELKIDMNKKNFLEVFENYRKFELTLGDIEGLLNLFLSEINLIIQFQIFINRANTKFFINPLFKRNNKEEIKFSGLTTPEKVFLVMALYITIKIIFNEKDIVFSNLFIPKEYNRGGSILRTITKILPLFENKRNLKDFKLIFIISNLEIKKEIKNLKIIQVQGS